MRILVLLLSIFWASLLSAQTYLIKIDTFKNLKMVAGKNYTFKTSLSKQKSKLIKIKGDSFFFESGKYAYNEITRIKNPNYNVAADAVTFPLTIGSCVTISIVPINYIKGYFLAETSKMMKQIAVFAGASIVFAISRTYQSKNPRWIRIAEMPKFEYTLKEEKKKKDKTESPKGEK